MTIDSLFPLFVLGTSLLTGLVIFLLKEEQHRLRTVLNMAGAVGKMVLVGIMVWGVFHERAYEFRFPLAAGIDLLFRADALAMLFMSLSAFLWLLTTIYAVGYLEGSPKRSRFFGFFSLCVTATMGISLAGNLITFFLFYEMLTVVTYPLVVHRGTRRAMRAGAIYAFYTLGGGAVLLAGISWLHFLAGPIEFASGGSLSGLAGEHRASLIAIFAVLIAGLGVKGSLFPFHGWLPEAMVAPAPVSALLHAVAVVKAGVFGIARVVYHVFGLETASALGVIGPLAAAAALTVLYGSLRALAQDDLKRRLAFSTVSQISYITLGVAVAGSLSTIGGLVHLVHQGIMKVTLFFCAGILSETLGISRIKDMAGVGRRLPLTMAAFTVGALGMIGLPPLAGFISKWYLGLGALQAGQPWALAVLVGSSLLNAAYFLPILNAAWFGNRADGPGERRPGLSEAPYPLLLPTLVTALFTLLAGLLAGTFFSPLEWVKLIVEREYGP